MENYEEMCANWKWAMEEIEEALRHLGQSRYYLRHADVDNICVNDAITSVLDIDDALRTIKMQLGKELNLQGFMHSQKKE